MNYINKILITLILCFVCLNISAQSKIAHINTTELVAAMPEMNDAKAELEKEEEEKIEILQFFKKTLI